MLDDQSKRASWFSVYALSLLIILSENPYILRRIGYWVTLPFCLLYFLSVLSLQIQVKKKDIFLFICTGSYTLIFIAYIMVGKSSAGLGAIVHFVLYFVFFVALDVVQRADEKQKLYMLGTVFISFLFTLFTNAISYYQYGARWYHQRLIEGHIPLNMMHIVGAPYVSSLVLMGGIMLIGYLHDRRLKWRFFWALMLAVCTLFIFMIAERAIAVLFSITLYGLIIIFNRKRTCYVKFGLFLGMCAVLLIVQNYELVIDTFNEIANSERLAVKLAQIKRFLTYGAIEYAGGSLTGRYELCMTSIQTWTSSIRSFLFGVGNHVSSNEIIGNHSDFIDVLAQYGIFVALFFYYAVIRSLRNLINVLPIYKLSIVYRQVLAVCCVFLLRGVIGHVVTETSAIQLFVVMPIVVSMLKEGERGS